jgi:hypothetical protein
MKVPGVAGKTVGFRTLVPIAALTCWVVAPGVQLTAVPVGEIVKPVVVLTDPDPVNMPVVGYTTAKVWVPATTPETGTETLDVVLVTWLRLY